MHATAIPPTHMAVLHATVGFTSWWPPVKKHGASTSLPSHALLVCNVAVDFPGNARGLFVLAFRHVKLAVSSKPFVCMVRPEQHTLPG